MARVKRTREGKTCTKCGEFKLWNEFPASKAKFDGYAYACRDCDNKRSREYYKSHTDKWILKMKLSQERYPEKWKARTAARDAVRAGKLIKLPCMKCGNPKVSAHHPDYSKPLKVMWLCQKHHMELHRKYGTKP